MTCDVAVIGAGPAGLAASVAAAAAGLRVVLVDAGDRLGGQYFRHPPDALRTAGPDVTPHGWAEFARLRDALTDHVAAGRVTHLAGHSVWYAEAHAVGAGARFTLHLNGTGNGTGAVQEMRSRTLVVATGAHDRPLPFPGWDLPGVLTAGGAQALLKGNLVVAGRRIVVAGTGPFLLPVAAGLASAGARVEGVFEAGRPERFARHGVRFLRNAGKLAEGAGYAATLLRHRVPFRMGHAVVAAHGDDAVESVTVARLDRDWTPVPGTERVIECDAVAVGYGFTPQMEIPVELGCATRTDADGSLVVVVDAAQRTSVPGVYAAGETTGVGGVQLALAEGELAGLAAAGELGVRTARPPRRLLARRAGLRDFAATLQDAYPVRPGWAGWLRPDTLVCRCEEVPYGRLDEAVRDLGATDPRTAKLISRVGMGWCQGRICGYPTACLTARIRKREPDRTDLAGFARRPLAQPVRLGDLAQSTADDGTDPADRADRTDLAGLADEPDGADRAEEV
ncbi:FAD-dependent oxidoreductase [Actinomadura sp. HBU206391]|uniref:FAD-dependent oxidoreductase n=1 Tax=Actinomadura sp. HBU206391 TaxID=2731692 RepID=UPI00164F39DB|nr:FAD-dependent oxidoreductase [Actinomadura sp. HBU206391]MBC6457526.1 FAD-dependent oxidoreductase [Actinomadura sp. HBU206391]